MGFPSNVSELQLRGGCLEVLERKQAPDDGAAQERRLGVLGNNLLPGAPLRTVDGDAKHPLAGGALVGEDVEVALPDVHHVRGFLPHHQRPEVAVPAQPLEVDVVARPAVDDGHQQHLAVTGQRLIEE